MLLETAGLFAVGEAHYYRGDGRANANDWQLPGNWSALGRKLTGDGIRFDSNGFATNAISHPVLFGATVHELARENGFSLAQSFLISSGISIAWEFIGEWREYASINDIATTSPAGTPIGEAAYQIIHHLRRTQFELHGGMGRVGGTSFHTIGASASLDTIPHHDEPGDSSGTIREGNKVALALEVPFDDSARAIDFRSRSSLYGYYRNHRDDDGNGYNLFVGIAGGYDYLQKMDRPDWQWDLLANVVAGPTIDLELHTHGVRLHTALDVSGDFAMVKSYAYGKWRDAHPMAVVQGVLQDNPHYYYYALGASLVPRIEIEGRGLAAGASFARSMFTSLDGHDRNQEIETTQIHLEDEEQTTTGWLRGQLAGVTLQVSASDRTREGRIGMTVDASTERTLVLSLGYRN
ncbi:MAG: DUF3943 domain-containing protein [Deltaproteobacteria bacterium]|nr:DUF3943 domain-containing protein [Deltaproteobacteria bacterium]